MLPLFAELVLMPVPGLCDGTGDESLLGALLYTGITVQPQL